MAKRLKTLVIVVFAAAYPFLGAYLIRNGWGGPLLTLLAALTLWRGLCAKQTVFRIAYLLGAALLLAGAYFAGAYAIRLIPAFVYLSLAALFGFTLWHPPSLCERLVRLQFAEFKQGIAEYLRQLTWVWTGFFAANVIICALLPIIAEDWVWTVYTGILVYVLMAVLVFAEYIYRPIRFPGLGIPPAMETMKIIMRQGHLVFKDIDR